MIEWWRWGSTGERCFPQAADRVFAGVGEALAAIVSCESEGVILQEARRGEAAPIPALEELADYDVCHAGLLLGGTGALGSAGMASAGWFLLDPPPDRPSVSWRATPAACWLRPQAVRAVGGLDAAYTSPTSRLMDLAYRLRLAGGRVGHHPGWLPPSAMPAPPVSLPLEDEFVFIGRHLGVRAALWVALWLAARTGVGLSHLLACCRRALARTAAVPSPSSRGNCGEDFRLMGTDRRQRVSGVSAIIPTLNRYHYLPRAIESLLRQDPPPDEIIVVDQTPPARRWARLYDTYASRKVRAIFLDQAGQSRARNAAIRAARTPWCLFFDDDSLAWDGMLAHHIRVVERSGAQASTGVSLAPWKTSEWVAPSFRRYHLADVLDTGNSLIHRDVVLKVGGFDLAFDRGSGADHDLGLRLYLEGCVIVFNPYAIRTHYKAATGGLRTHGAWWRQKSGLWDPFPPPTQIYTIRRYYRPAYWYPLYLLQFLGARNKHTPAEYGWLLLTALWKLSRAQAAASRLRTCLGLADAGDGEGRA